MSLTDKEKSAKKGKATRAKNKKEAEGKDKALQKARSGERNAKRALKEYKQAFKDAMDYFKEQNR